MQQNFEKEKLAPPITPQALLSGLISSLALFSFFFTMFSLLHFSKGSGAVFQFVLRQANPFHMFLSQTRFVMPLFLLAIWFLAMSKLAFSEREDSKYYVRESIPSIFFVILITMLPKWGWLLIPVVLVFNLYFIRLVKRFRKTNNLPKSLRRLIYLRVWAFSQRNYLAFIAALFVLVIPPNGAWMKTEIITTTSHATIKAFVEEGNFGLTYLDVHNHRIGFIKSQNILQRHPCTVLRNIQPWFNSEDLVSATSC